MLNGVPKCPSPRRVLACAVFAAVLCCLFFAWSCTWHRLESGVYRVLRTVGPMFRGSCLPVDGTLPPHVNITVVSLHHEKDELYEVRARPYRVSAVYT